MRVALPEVRVLIDGVDLTIGAGEVVVLLGGSGAGLTGDLLDPRPERLRYAVRAAFLVWIYAWGIASDVVAKGGAPKPEAMQ